MKNYKRHGTGSLTPWNYQKEPLKTKIAFVMGKIQQDVENDS